MNGSVRKLGCPILSAAVLSACAVLSGCQGGGQIVVNQGHSNGNADAGKNELVGYGCGGCHVIPGIRSAKGMVGPPLLYFSRRTMIAGELPNTPENLVRWIKNPQEIEPGTAMPNLGVPDDKARDMAAYLYTLR